MANCTGKRCPMQVGYKVDECDYKDCPYRTEPITNEDYVRMVSDEKLSEFSYLFRHNLKEWFKKNEEQKSYNKIIKSC